MNNYKQSYFEYANHSLNRSPSKTSYTFSKASRFPQKQPQISLMDYSQCKFHQGLKNLPSTSRRQISPDRKIQTSTPDLSKNKINYQEKQENKNTGRIIKTQYKQMSKSQTKLPLKKQSNQLRHVQKLKKQDCQKGKQKSVLRQAEKGKNTQVDVKNKKNSPSPLKKASKSPQRQNTHRVQTQTRYLLEIDHVSKNITNRGYYPTGIQISPEGKYPISTIKNRPTYTFGKPIQQQRYFYINKNSNDLGPGYYKNYSQFGPTKRK